MYVPSFLTGFAILGFAAASFEEPRQPTGQWVVKFEDAQCLAARNYGTIEKPLYLVIKIPPLGEVVQVAVLRDRPALRAEQLRGTLLFGEREPIKINMLEYKQGDGGMRTLIANVRESDFAAAREAGSIKIKTAGIDERFAVTSMPELLQTMDRCVADLRRVWNIRNEEEGRPPLEKGAKGDMRALFDANDYPTQALLEGGTGAVRVLILITEKGTVDDCALIDTSGIPTLDAQACAVLTHRAKFIPAIGSDGKPAKSAYVQMITWRIQ